MSDEAGFDQVVDVVVAGSGAGGMVTALRAAANGLEAVVVEKAEFFGGNSALSGGGSWTPNAPYFKRRGLNDDPAQVLQYLRTIAPEVPPERQQRYLDEVPKTMEFLESSRWFDDGFVWSEGYSDYHPDKGGNPDGRGLWPVPIDQRKLGEDEKFLRGGTARVPGAPKGMWVTGIDYHSLIALKWGGWRGRRMMLKLAGRIIKSRLTGQRIATSGSALLTRLRLALRDANVPLWLNSPIKSVITNDEGRVVGAVIERDGKTIRVGARRGVVLATGGFEWSKEMRAKYQPEVPVGWSNGSPDNTGDGHKVAEEAGTAMEFMDDAWWMPAMDLGAGVWPLVAERCFPGQIIVNETGKRFINEATPYTDFGHVLIEGQRSGVKHIPCYMIIDDRAWKRNLIAGHLPGKKMPQAWIDSGKVFQADTLEELAGKIGVPGDALKETVERWNGMVRKGVDEDFHRGESAYANYYGDPSYDRPNLGEIDKPPYIAFTLVPGDLGTKGGVQTDENARALREDGSVIPGLYATGNVSAAVMGNSYAGPGATIGPAMTFGYVAADDMAKTEPADIEPATASAASQ